jgi:hypothetical protein
MDPYERGLEEGGGAIDFLARNIWLLVPVGQKVKAFFADYEEFPTRKAARSTRAGSTTGCCGRRTR